MALTLDTTGMRLFLSDALLADPFQAGIFTAGGVSHRFDKTENISPEGGTSIAGGVNHRNSPIEILQAGGRHKWRALVPPSGLIFSVLSNRWLTPPAVNMPA